GAALGSISNSVITIIDNDSVISFSTASYSVSENAGTASITVNRLGGTVGFVSVDFLTSDGTATAPADYASVSTTLFWFDQDGTSRTVPISIVNDSLTEGDETVQLRLTNVFGSATTGVATATLTIIDDDFGPGTISFSTNAYRVSET